MIGKPWIKKEHPEIPDSFKMTIYYIDGKSETFDVADMSAVSERGCFEFATTEDEFSWVPIAQIKRIAFDKNYSKMVEIRRQIILDEENRRKNLNLETLRGVNGNSN